VDSVLTGPGSFEIAQIFYEAWQYWTGSKGQGLTTGQLRQAVIHTRQKLATSERRTCRVIGLARSSLQYQPAQKDRDDEDLRLGLIRLAKQYGCYG